MMARYRHLAVPAAILAVFVVTAVPTIRGLPAVGGPESWSEHPWRDMQASEVWQRIAEERMRHAVGTGDFMDRLRGYRAADSAALESVRLAPANQGAWIVRAEAAWRERNIAAMLDHVRVLLKIAPYETYRATTRIEFALDGWDRLTDQEREAVYRQIRWAQWWSRQPWYALLRRRPEFIDHWIAATADDPAETERREIMLRESGLDRLRRQ